MKKKATIRRISPPLSDEELAAAERTENARTQARIEQIEDEKEQTRLAAAGDPDAVAALESLRAGASVLSGRPAIDEDEPPVLTPKVRKPKSVRHREKPVDPEPSSPDDAEIRDQAREEKAFKLMDAVFRKWGKSSEKNPREAFRELARDMGQDMALYVRAGLLRLTDAPDLLMKMTAMGKSKDEPADGGGEDFDQEMESFREALRGGK